jgi:hypothetical protein
MSGGRVEIRLWFRKKEKIQVSDLDVSVGSQCMFHVQFG